MATPLIPDQVTINLAQDSKTLEQCLKSFSSYGQTTYMNICTGTQSVIPWGSVDWVIALLLTALGVAVVGGLIIGLCALIFDH